MRLDDSIGTRDGLREEKMRHRSGSKDVFKTTRGHTGSPTSGPLVSKAIDEAEFISKRAAVNNSLSEPLMAAAGIIFGCTDATYDECFELGMVGLPRKYLPLVESIVQGHTLIFLFNFSDRQLHGLYTATSIGMENMNQAAWKNFPPAPKTGRTDEVTGLERLESEDKDGSPFPAQCSFAILEEFAPVPEAEFKHVLEYTERQRFKFKLSRWQCRDLVESMCRYDAKLRSTRLKDELHLG